MKIASDMVGLKFRPYSIIVSKRHAANYAASIGDMNPIYFDDMKNDEVIAHPMFAVALTWPLIEHMHDYVDLPYQPEQAQSVVHFMEHLEFHGTIMPGDHLTIYGEIAAVSPVKAGTFVVLRFKAVNQDGLPIFTEHQGGVHRGVECADQGRGMESIPVVATETAGNAPTWEESVFINPQDPYVYDGCTGIVFDIHTSPRFARSVGLPGIILQGTATLAHAVRHVVDRELGGDPRRLTSIAGQFRAMVIPNTSITIQALEKTQPEQSELHFRVLNQQGKSAVTSGCIQYR